MKKIFFLFFILTTPTIIPAQKIDKQLQQQINTLVAGFNGQVGIYIKNLHTNKTVMINADTIFPTASIVKIPILVGIADKIYKGELAYEEELIYKDSLLYGSGDILGSFKNNEKITLKKALMLMLTTSDNTASLWLQSLAGTGIRINEILDQTGFVFTRVNSRTAGRETFRTQYGWGQTTPKEMGILLEKIYQKKLFTPALCERMMRCLGKNLWDTNEAISQIPPTIEVFSKNGCVDASRSEVMIVNAPHNPYLLSIFTKNNKDIRWVHDNEAWVLARKISALLWNYFEPKMKYTAPE
ncbi:MAG TPA: serine hydrolase [Chitinophagaceae bacterium]|nr:serine hydrolase [Chitinophagaceae bacterium]